jgi:hypothetical protein
MAHEQQHLGTLQLKGNFFIARRFGKDGKRAGKKTKWRVKAKSNLPRELFFKIRGFLQSSIKKHGTESLDDLVAAVRGGLAQAGWAYSCQIKKGSRHADIYWCEDGKRLIGWQIHTGGFDERMARKLTRSRAVFRLVVVVSKGGYFRIMPMNTRLRDS